MMKLSSCERARKQWTNGMEKMGYRIKLNRRQIIRENHLPHERRAGAIAGERKVKR